MLISATRAGRVTATLLRCAELRGGFLLGWAGRWKWEVYVHLLGIPGGGGGGEAGLPGHLQPLMGATLAEFIPVLSSSFSDVPVCPDLSCMPHSSMFFSTVLILSSVLLNPTLQVLGPFRCLLFAQLIPITLPLRSVHAFLHFFLRHLFSFFCLR